MSQGTVAQRHSRKCPRDPSGQFRPHRCRGQWFFIVDAGRKPDGRRRQVHRGGFATKREAQTALEQELARQKAGLAELHSLTVEQYLRSWLVSKRKLRDTTRRNYATHLRLYLVPALGRIRLMDLRPDHVDDLYGDLLSGRYVGATAATVQHVHRTLRSALNTAVKRRLIPWNPALFVEVPEHHRARTRVWTAEDLASFLGAIFDERLYALFHLLSFTGMRRGEALGLQWGDVDLARSQLLVTRQVTDAGQGPRLGAPKTVAGARFVPIDPGTVDVLRRHQARQLAEAASWGPGWNDLGLVFTKEDGTLLRPDAVTALFRRLVRRNALPRIRLHDLRHTHASLALAAGVDLKVVSSRLGHSNVAITSDLYTHVVPSVARRAADAIAAAVPLERPVRGRRVTPLLPRNPEATKGRGPPDHVSAGQDAPTLRATFPQARKRAGTGTRTRNLPITSRVRYQLRHAGRAPSLPTGSHPGVAGWASLAAALCPVHLTVG
jgi:integrase